MSCKQFCVLVLQFYFGTRSQGRLLITFYIAPVILSVVLLIKMMSEEITAGIKIPHDVEKAIVYHTLNANWQFLIFAWETFLAASKFFKW